MSSLPQYPSELFVPHIWCTFELFFGGFFMSVFYAPLFPDAWSAFGRTILKRCEEFEWRGMPKYFQILTHSVFQNVIECIPIFRRIHINICSQKVLFNVNLMLTP